MDTILILLINYFISTTPLEITYHNCYSFRGDTLTEVTDNSYDAQDWTGRFYPPNKVHIAIWENGKEQNWYQYKSVHKLKKLLGWQRFRILFTVVHELVHWKRWASDDSQDEDEVDREAEEMLNESFLELEKIIN